MPFMMSSNPGRPIAADRVLRFDNVSTTNAWLLANPERVVGGVHFEGTEALGQCAKGHNFAERRGSRRAPRQPGHSTHWAQRHACKRSPHPAQACPRSRRSRAGLGAFSFLLQVNQTPKFFKDVRLTGQI